MGMLAHPLVALRRVRILPRSVRRIDARAARAINGHRHLPWLDSDLVRLSHLADRSRLWAGIALLLVLSGGARRRGALRGALSLAAGSALANLVGKRVFGGDRPLLKDVPVPRRLKSFPTSASFPSGHSASAAAFVTGVALEDPRAGAVLAPLGAAVAYSRLRTGAHWLSDVVGGAVLGAGVAVAGRMLFPVPPRTEAEPVGIDVALPTIDEGTGVVIFVNRTSGIDPLRPDPVDFLSEALPDARLHLLEPGDDVTAVVQEAVASAERPAVLGVWGGDGSVAAVADGARRAGLPLLTFPGGTFNHFARTAGIPNLEDAVAALRAGTGRRVDVAELTIDDARPCTVLNAASVGVYPDFVAERESLERRLGKPLAALVAAVRVLAKADTLDVLVDGRRARVWSVAVAVGESTSPSMVPLQRRELDDAVLEVRVLHAHGRAPRLRGLVALGVGARASSLLDRVPGRRRLPTIESFRARMVRIRVLGTHGQAIGVAHDGEVEQVELARSGGSATVSVAVVPGGLDVYSAH